MGSSAGALFPVPLRRGCEMHAAPVGLREGQQFHALPGTDAAQHAIYHSPVNVADELG